MDEFLQQVKMAMESHMNCEVEVTGPTELSVSSETDGVTHTYTMTVRED